MTKSILVYYCDGARHQKHRYIEEESWRWECWNRDRKKEKGERGCWNGGGVIEQRFSFWRESEKRGERKGKREKCRDPT